MKRTLFCRKLWRKMKRKRKEKKQIKERLRKKRGLRKKKTEETNGWWICCQSVFTCCTYHCVEFWFFLWLLGLQGAQSSRGASLFTPLTLADAGGDVGLSPSSPNTGHSIHVWMSAELPLLLSLRFCLCNSSRDSSDQLQHSPSFSRFLYFVFPFFFYFSDSVQTREINPDRSFSLCFSFFLSICEDFATGGQVASCTFVVSREFLEFWTQFLRHFSLTDRYNEICLYLIAHVVQLVLEHFWINELSIR